jgi:glutathione S-transferase
MRLYHHPHSTFSRRVRIQLHEKGVSIDECVVDMAKGEHKGPAYRALNPYARVPLLVDGDFVLFESSAIMEYLELMFPQPSLVPTKPRGRALVSMHVKLCDVEFGSETRSVIFPRRFLPRERWDIPAQEKAIGRIAKHLAVLDAQLAGKDFLVEDRFTLADLAYAPFMDFLPLLQLTPPANVGRWMQMLASRPSVAATQASR